jgi:hypothetical protein
MLKLLAASMAIFMLSGCCELFGICTSVAVHSSISSPQQFAQADTLTAGNAMQQTVLADAPLQPQTAADSCTASPR